MQAVTVGQYSSHPHPSDSHTWWGAVVLRDRILQIDRVTHDCQSGIEPDEDTQARSNAELPAAL